MEMNIYIGFWTLKMKCTQYGLYGQAAFKNAKIILDSEDQGSYLFDVALACCPDACNACWEYLERPLNWEPRFLNRPISAEGKDAPYEAIKEWGSF
jgi:hypothetical protein